MKQILSIFVLLILLQGSYAQIGINNSNPDDNSVLDLKATNKGLLIPRLSTTQREAMSTGTGFSQGMMVYDITLDILFVGYGNGASGNTKWYAMNPWKTEYRKSNNASVTDMTTMTVNPGATVGSVGMANYGNVGIGIVVPQEKLHVNGQIKATGFKGYGITPVGGIIMWKGAVSAIPAGWKLCDGANGTPDLRDKFVIGAGAAYSVNNEGGLNSVTLTASQSALPQHQHSINHGHTGGDNGHAHSIPSRVRGNEDGSNEYTWANGSGKSTGKGYANIYIDNHSGNSGFQSQVNAVASHENRPPYYALAYIMRTL